MLKFASIVLALTLAGCSTGGRFADQLNTAKNAGPCPVVGSVYDASRYVKFADEGAPKLYTNIAYSGEITDVRLFCRYTGQAPLEAEIEIDFAFARLGVVTVEAMGFEEGTVFFRKSCIRRSGLRERTKRVNCDAESE